MFESILDKKRDPKFCLSGDINFAKDLQAFSIAMVIKYFL